MLRENLNSNSNSEIATNTVTLLLEDNCAAISNFPMSEGTSHKIFNNSFLSEHSLFIYIFHPVITYRSSDFLWKRHNGELSLITKIATSAFNDMLFVTILATENN